MAIGRIRVLLRPSVEDVDGATRAQHLPGVSLRGGALRGAALLVRQALCVDELERRRRRIDEVDARVLDREQLVGEHLDEHAEFLDGGDACERSRGPTVELAAHEQPAVGEGDLLAREQVRQAIAERQHRVAEFGNRGVVDRGALADERDESVEPQRKMDDMIAVGAPLMAHGADEWRLADRALVDQGLIRHGLRVACHREPLEAAVIVGKRTPEPDLARGRVGRAEQRVGRALRHRLNVGPLGAAGGEDGVEIGQRHRSERRACALHGQSRSMRWTVCVRTA